MPNDQKVGNFLAELPNRPGSRIYTDWIGRAHQAGHGIAECFLKLIVAELASGMTEEKFGDAVCDVIEANRSLFEPIKAIPISELQRG